VHFSQLTVLNHSVFGEYKCRASNTLGYLERVVVLHEGAQPATPEMQVRATMPDSLTVELQAAPEQLNFQGPAALDVTAFRVQIKRKDDFEWTGSKVLDFPAGTSNNFKTIFYNKDQFYIYKLKYLISTVLFF